MGNNPSNNSQPGNRNSVRASQGSKGSSLHPFARKKLQEWLGSVPFTLNSDQTQGVYEAVTSIELDSPRLLVTKGSEPVGVYVVLSGDAEVVSDRHQYILRVIPPGDCFGEVAVMYDTPCTADVRIPTKASLLLLKTADARRLFSLPPELPLLEWCSKRKYFDTGGLFRGPQLSKSVALKALQHVPVLHDWGMEALKEVIDTIKQDIIVLHPSGSAVYREGDVGQEMHVLVHGRVEFSTGDQNIAVFDAAEREFSFGEEGFFASTVKRSTVRALTPCQVITLKKEHFYDVLNKYPTEHVLLQMFNQKWKENVEKRDESLFTKYGGALDLEILRMALKQSEVFKDCPPGFLYTVALSMVVKEIQEEQSVLSHTQYSKGGRHFLLLRGRAVVAEEDDIFDTIGVKQVFRKSPEYPAKAWVKATELSVVAYFTSAVIAEAQSAYPYAAFPSME